MESAQRRRTPWRDNLEALVMAVVMALFLKCFVIEAYKIPTGSMQPTLIGDEGADVKDRILVDKLTYVFRDPERWEVAVFRYPLDRSKSFVKRIAGVGPEELRIRNGDVWHRAPGAGSWSIARRPRSVQEAAWKPLDRDEPEGSHWIPRNLPHGSRWSCRGRAIEARGPGTVFFRGGAEPITDGYLDGYPEELVPYLPAHHEESDRNAVGDLRVSGEIRALAGLERFVVVLSEGKRSYRFELPGPAAAEGASARIVADAFAVAPDEPLPPAALPYRLPAERAVRFAAQNLDDVLELELEGVRLALAIAPAEDQDSSVALTLAGAGADLSELMVQRDIYYTQDGTDSVQVPAGCYFMLGDNTQDSSDSREWIFASFDLTGADGAPRHVRGNWRDRENPRTVGHGEPEGPFTYMVDEFGERCWFRRDEARRGDPEPAPFVPRSMIQGKALAVFWPLDPVRDIWRLEWVN